VKIIEMAGENAVCDRSRRCRNDVKAWLALFPSVSENRPYLVKLVAVFSGYGSAKA